MNECVKATYAIFNGVGVFQVTFVTDSNEKKNLLMVSLRILRLYAAQHYAFKCLNCISNAN